MGRGTEHRHHRRLSGNRAGHEGLRRARAARQGQEDQDGRHDPGQQDARRQGHRERHRRPPRPQGAGLGWRRRPARRARRPAAARRRWSWAPRPARSSASSPSTRWRAASRESSARSSSRAPPPSSPSSDDRDRLAVEQALPGSPAKSVAQMDEGVRASRTRWPRPWASSTPTARCCRSPTAPSAARPAARSKRLGRRLVDDPRPEAAGGRAERPARPHRRRRLRQPDTFGGPVATPNFTRVQEMGLTYNRFHVTAVCSPTRAALLTGRNQHRVGFGSIAEYPGPFPGYTAAKPKSCAGLPAHPAGERLRHRRLRQVAPDARQRAGRGGSVRPLAASRGASTTGGAS